MANYLSAIKIFCIFLLLTIVIAACEKDEIIPPIDTPIEKTIDLSIYIGNYTLSVNHITGIHSQYDSIGNYLGMGIDTISNIPMNIEISQHNDTDSLLIKGLIATHLLNCCEKEVYGVIQNDSITLVRELSTNSTND